jgi:hypothetical protein
MVEIPDDIRGYLKQLQKYHFWLLALLMPLILVPLAFTADAQLLREIDSLSSAVKAKVDSINSVPRKTAEGLEEFGHPQSEWSEQISQSNDALRETILSQWTYLWDQQKPIRVWPSELRNDFLRAVIRLKPGDDLSTRFRDRYLNTIHRVVRKLPERIDATESMDSSANDGGFGRGDFGMPNGVVDDSADRTVLWDSMDQGELYQSFFWTTTPSTKQILLAQEELWAYAILCDVVLKANNQSSGYHDATIPYISRLAVGYRAAEEDPGGRKGGRIKTTSSGSDEYMDMDMGMDMDGQMGKPLNPRFASSAQGDMGMEYDEFSGMPIESDSEDNDDALLNWIYVDSDGKPLDSVNVADSPDTKFVHYIPFCLQGKVDQRKLDLLLRSFATMSVPIDVRQVRINPDATDLMGDEGGMMGGMASGQGSTDGVRRYDLDVELRGSIALSQRPDAKALGLETEPQN